MRGWLWTGCAFLLSTLAAQADGGSAPKFANVWQAVGIFAFIAVLVIIMRKNEKAAKKLADPALPEGEELIYNRVVNTNQGVGFAFGATRQAVYWFGIRIPLAEIKAAGLKPQATLSKRTVLTVFLVLALVLFVILWRALESAVAGVVGAVALILLGLIVMALTKSSNTGVQKLTVLRQNGKRHVFNPYLQNIDGNLRAQYIAAQEEAADVLKNLQVPELTGA